MKQKKNIIPIIFLILSITLSACGNTATIQQGTQAETTIQETQEKKPEPQHTSKQETETNNLQSHTSDTTDIPEYSGSPYTEINGNTPYFSDSDMTTKSFEKYSDLDYLGRCGVAYACIGTDLMPTEERGDISNIHPSGWQSIKCESADGGWLYNRCHLIGFQLSGENDNEKNLITGTRYMNVDGMLPFENMVADFVKETGNHVLYRVTPVFSGENLVADGVLMEAQSVEDNGEDILFCVYCYNIQPGMTIDYATGNAVETGETIQPNTTSAVDADYILNTNSKKFHKTTCPSVGKMSEKNKKEYTGTKEELIDMGYSPCGSCNP